MVVHGSAAEIITRLTNYNVPFSAKKKKKGKRFDILFHNNTFYIYDIKGVPTKKEQ